MKHHLLAVALVVGITFVAGCSTTIEEKPAVKQSQTGTYLLVAIDGNPLPFTPRTEGGAPAVHSGTMTLNTDSTFTSVMSYAVENGRVKSRDFFGEFERTETGLGMTWEGGLKTTASVSGSTLTMLDRGIVLTFRK